MYMERVVMPAVLVAQAVYRKGNFSHFHLIIERKLGFHCPPDHQFYNLWNSNAVYCVGRNLMTIAQDR
ncbi:MAG: hypothetical protein R6V48_02940, partial [Fidelibacterota bacterium]